VRELAREFRDRRIPCDVIHLDIDYMSGYRVFTWSTKRFS
jgi:alpha-glucosidase